MTKRILLLWMCFCSLHVFGLLLKIHLESEKASSQTSTDEWANERRRARAERFCSSIVLCTYYYFNTNNMNWKCTQLRLQANYEHKSLQLRHILNWGSNSSTKEMRIKTNAVQRHKHSNEERERESQREKEIIFNAKVSALYVFRVYYAQQPAERCTIANAYNSCCRFHFMRIVSMEKKSFNNNGEWKKVWKLCNYHSKVGLNMGENSALKLIEFIYFNCTRFIQSLFLLNEIKVHRTMARNESEVVILLIDNFRFVIWKV